MRAQARSRNKASALANASVGSRGEPRVAIASVLILGQNHQEAVSYGCLLVIAPRRVLENLRDSCIASPGGELTEGLMWERELALAWQGMNRAKQKSLDSGLGLIEAPSEIRESTSSTLHIV